MKISVLIPIYNVADYLPRCIESVIHQTFSDMEIILIDDGSTDGSSGIADKYKARDSRIKVIHKKNGGLSDARNAGMQEAKGDYLFFLDSDDWLVTHALETLYDTLQTYAADIVVCGFYYAYDTEVWLDKRYWNEDETVRILNNEEAMKALLENEYIKNFAWGKLYKRKMIQDILFEKGVLFEDVFWQPQVFARSQKCVVIRKAECYYYQRRDSIVAKFNIKKLDMLRALNARHAFVEAYYPQLISESWYSLLKAYLEYYAILFFNPGGCESKKYRQAIRHFVCLHDKEINAYSRKDKQQYIKLKLFRIHPILFMIYGAMRKLTRIVGIRKEEEVLIRIHEE